MQNKGTLTYHIPQYLQSSYDDFLEFTLQSSSSFNLDQDTLPENNTSTEIHIIRRIKNYNLAWPLILTISYEDELIFVESEMPYIWGEGDTLKEALKSFEDFFLYEFESYKNTALDKMDFFARQEYKLYKVLLNIS